MNVAEVIFAVALYAIPLVALPFACRERSQRRVALAALIVAPLTGAAVSLTLVGDFSVGLWLLVYPFALMPLGLWAAVLVAALLPAVRRVGTRSPYGLAGVAAGGALVGAAAMLGLVTTAPLHELAGEARGPWVAAGAVTGLVLAILAARETRVGSPGR